jgi:hypothetical protein
MKNSKLLKGITLVGFVMMLSAFVAYRSGGFNQSRAESNYDGNYIMRTDSPPAKQTIMSGSKSIRIIENQQTTGTVSTNTYVPQNVMPSSKSGGFFRESDVRTNTQTPAQKSSTAITVTSTFVPSTVIPSSKSAGVFTGKDVQTVTVSSPPPPKKIQAVKLRQRIITLTITSICPLIMPTARMSRLIRTSQSELFLYSHSHFSEPAGAGDHFCSHGKNVPGQSFAKILPASLDA